MLDIIALSIAAVSLAVSVLVARYALRERLHVDQLSAALKSIREAQIQFDALPADFAPSPLEGCRIALCIEQDHKLPVLVNLIKERLEAEDAQVVTFSTEQAEELASATKWDPGMDLPHALVRGRLQCNAYREVYFEADLTFLFAQGIVGSILERPPNGSRQANLAIGVVKTLKQTLEQAAKRAERSAALGELNLP